MYRILVKMHPHFSARTLGIRGLGIFSRTVWFYSKIRPPNPQRLVLIEAYTYCLLHVSSLIAVSYCIIDKIKDIVFAHARKVGVPAQLNILFWQN